MSDFSIDPTEPVAAASPPDTYEPPSSPPDTYISRETSRRRRLVARKD